MRTFFKWWAGAWALALVLSLPPAAVTARVARSRRAAVTASVQTETEPKYIALTFDDGPRRSTTAELLDALQERGAHATFFLIGEQIEGSEDLVERMEAEGHQVGIHTFSHVYLTALNNADFSRQVESTRSAIEGLVGHGGLLLRPPYGMVDAGVRRRAGKTCGPDGDIILLHDIYPSSVEAAVKIVDRLHREGFLFLTVSELARERQVELKNGEVYNSFPG